MIEKVSKIRHVFLQPATLTLLATIVVAGSFALLHRNPVISRQEKSFDSIQTLNVRAVDEEGQPVAGATIRTEDTTTNTDALGTAQLRTSLSDHTIRLESTSPGYESSSTLIELPRRDANVTVVLTREKKPIAAGNQPFTGTVRSGPRPSGVGREFSAWYELSSPPVRDGYVISGYELLSLEIAVVGLGPSAKSNPLALPRLCIGFACRATMKGLASRLFQRAF
jgi:hypothetical protein